MKSIEEIEKLDLDELEAIADDARIPVPEDLRRGLDDVILSLSMVDSEMKRHRRRRMVYGICTAVACLQIFLLTGLKVMHDKTAPVDTFDNPEEAYAVVQETMDRVGVSICKGIGAVERGREVADRSFEKVGELLK